MKKKKKGISRYTVMFIPDTSDNAKSYELTFDTIARWIVAVLALFAVIICLFISVIIRNNEAMYGENGFMAQITALKEENESLKAGLKAESAPTEALPEEDVSGEPDQNDIPGVFPINGTATIIKDPTSQAESYPDRLVMLALSGSEVAASADGVVKEIYTYEPAENEFSYAIMIDHRNGYETVYLISGEPYIIVQKGSKLKRGDVLAKLSDEETIVGYDIMYGGASLDPSGLMSEE